MPVKKNSNGHENGVMGAVSEMPMNKTRILVADDHPLVREALTAIISRRGDFICCGEAANTVETQRAVALLKPDLILLDFWLDQGDGLELIKTLKSQSPSLRILVVSQSDEALCAEQALRAGAHGFVKKEEPAGEILTAIQTVLAGEFYVSPKVSGGALPKLVENGSQNGNSRVECLTDRELQVLRLLGEGLGTRKIADELNLSFKTVETHRENIKHKLGLSDAGELVRYAAFSSRNKMSSSSAKVAA